MHFVAVHCLKNVLSCGHSYRRSRGKARVVKIQPATCWKLSYYYYNCKYFCTYSAVKA